MDESVATNDECFLCSPSEDLQFFESENFFALAGLGPVVDGYCVIAAKAHSRSMADITANLRAERAEFVQKLRDLLTSRYGSCLSVSVSGSTLWSKHR